VTQWEKAAHGGLIGMAYPWGNEPPTVDNCDFGHFGEYHIQRSRTYPPNHYGLYTMSGGIWEWTRDWYQSDYYGTSPAHNPEGPVDGEEKVLRGGSWSDGSDVVTVSFRNSRASRHWFREEGQYGWGDHISPNIGFRLCRLIRHI
jgi:sulfatase modifying factor 1